MFSAFDHNRVSQKNDMYDFEKLFNFLPHEEAYQKAYSSLVNKKIHPKVIQFFNHLIGKIILSADEILTENAIKNLFAEFEKVFKKINQAEHVVLIIGAVKSGKSCLINYLSGTEFELFYDTSIGVKILKPNSNSTVPVKIHDFYDIPIPQPIPIAEINGITCVEIPDKRNYFEEDFLEMFIKRCISSARNLKGVMHVMRWNDLIGSVTTQVFIKENIENGLALIANAKTEIPKFAIFRDHQEKPTKIDNIPTWVVVSEPQSSFLTDFDCNQFRTWSQANLTKILGDNYSNWFEEVFIFRGITHSLNSTDHRDHKEAILQRFEKIKSQLNTGNKNNEKKDESSDIRLEANNTSGPSMINAQNWFFKNNVAITNMGKNYAKVNASGAIFSGDVVITNTCRK